MTFSLSASERASRCGYIQGSFYKGGLHFSASKNILELQLVPNRNRPVVLYNEAFPSGSVRPPQFRGGLCIPNLFYLQPILNMLYVSLWKTFFIFYGLRLSFLLGESASLVNLGSVLCTPGVCNCLLRDLLPRLHIL